MSSASMNSASAPAPHPTADQKPEAKWEDDVSWAFTEHEKLVRAIKAYDEIRRYECEEADMEERIRLHVLMFELIQSIGRGPGSIPPDNTKSKPKWLTWIEAADTGREKRVRLQLYEYSLSSPLYNWEDFVAAPNFQISKEMGPNLANAVGYIVIAEYCRAQLREETKESSDARSEGQDGGNTKREGSVAEAESSKSKRKWQTGVEAAGTDVCEKETRLQLSEDSGNLDLPIRVEEVSDPNSHMSKRRKTMFNSEDPTKRPIALERHPTWLENKGETSKATSGGHDSGFTNQDDRVPVEEDKGRKDEGKDGGNREQDERFVEDEGKELKGF